MLNRLRALRPVTTRTVLTGVLALSTLAVPSATPAAAAPLPAYRVVRGTVLEPLPPRFVRPVRSYRLTGRFGDTSYHWRSVHTGLDFAARSGTPIRSVSDGVVLAAGYDGRYGNKTVIRLADGTELWYCHQTAIDVRAGQHVRAGAVIGYVGATGNVTGPHLHLEVRPRVDHPVDPASWLRHRGVRV